MPMSIRDCFVALVAADREIGSGNGEVATFSIANHVELLSHGSMISKELPIRPGLRHGCFVFGIFLDNVLLFLGIARNFLLEDSLGSFRETSPLGDGPAEEFLRLLDIVLDYITWLL